MQVTWKPAQRPIAVTMPTFLLHIKANLENVQRLRVPSDYNFEVTLKDSMGDDTKRVFISTDEEIALSGSRGTANFVMKWDKSSKKECYVNVISVKNVTRDYSEEDNGNFAPVIGFECRGVEPIEFTPGEGFEVESSGGKMFDEVDLSEKDWCEFDDDAGVPVGVYEFESKFEVHS